MHPHGDIPSGDGNSSVPLGWGRQEDYLELVSFQLSMWVGGGVLEHLPAHRGGRGTPLEGERVGHRAHTVSVSCQL